MNVMECQRIYLNVTLLCDFLQSFAIIGHFRSKDDKVTNDASRQIALPMSDNPIAMVTDLSEGLLYKLDVICISLAQTNFVTMKLLATCYLLNYFQLWDEIIHKWLIFLNQYFFLAVVACIHIIYTQLNENQTIFRFLLGTEQDMEKALVPLFS